MKEKVIKENNSVYIPSVDAKDLYLANTGVNPSPNGYTLHLRDGSVNYRKYINTIPYSLDLIKLRSVYERAYRNSKFSWVSCGKEYSNRVINVTFKYAVKEFNRISQKIYVKDGYSYIDIHLEDSVDVRNGELAAIQVDTPVKNPLPKEVLGDNFNLVDGKYKARTNIPHTMSRAELRENLYVNGFMVDGVRYVRFKRSSGSARVGKCLFIDEKLYGRFYSYDLAGLDIYKGVKIDLAAFESYISLTSSSIIDTIEIRPENILLVDDYKSVFKENAVATYLDENGALRTEHKEVNVENSIWDGQSLMDTSLFGKYRDKGFLLLRNRFFKSAAFNCNLQQFFADNGITSVNQLNGKTRATRIEDVKLITTPSSIKYLKFGSFDRWLDNLITTFGIVKHEKPTHFFNGRLVQTHYQLINTLQLTEEEVGRLLQPSIDYISLLKTNPTVFRYHIKYPQNDEFDDETPLKSKNDIVYRLIGMNDRFTKTRLYVDFRNESIKAFTKDLRKGKILVNGTYCTLCGNPIEMLKHSVGQFTGDTQIGVGYVHNVRFKYGQTLLGSRSPHVTMGNVWLTVNQPNKEIDRYFRCTDEIVYVNSINENLLERLSGADFDSDTVLLTDNPILVEAAKRNYNNFAVPTGLVSSVKGKQPYLPEYLAKLDVNTSVNKIGEIINLSQELNTRLWDMVNSGKDVNSEEVQSLYNDIARLDVLSNLEIDRAKRILPVDNSKELALLKEKHKLKDEDGRSVKPNFFKPVSASKGYYDPKKNKYLKHKTSMDYVQTVMNKRKHAPYILNEYAPLSEIITERKRPTNKQLGQIHRIIAMVRQMRAKVSVIWGTMEGVDTAERHILAERERAECLDCINKMEISDVVFKELLHRISKPENSDIYTSVFYALFSLKNKNIANIIKTNREKLPRLEEAEDGDIDILGIKFKEIL